MELKLLNKTKSPSGGTFTAINHDGTKTEKSYGEIITSEYECPCGKGKIVSTYEDIPGYRDRYAHIECVDCIKDYNLSFVGVMLGDAPAVNKNEC
jgi:hypothetical protein